MKLTENECKLIEENFPLVYWFAAMKYPNEHALITLKIDTDDLVELGIIGLCKAAQTYKPECGKFSTWFSKIAKREVLQEIRRNSRGGRKVLTTSVSYDIEVNEDVGASIVNLIPSGEPGPLESIISKELLSDMYRLVDSSLTKDQVETFKMWFFDNISQREISKRTGVFQSAVSRRVSRGAARLCKSMRGLGYEGSDVV